MDFLIATHNMKKRAELERILKPIGVRVLLAEEAGVELTDVEETGVTFEENAFLKADSGCKESGMPCIADDSGLAVDALVTLGLEVEVRRVHGPSLNEDARGGLGCLDLGLELFLALAVERHDQVGGAVAGLEVVREGHSLAFCLCCTQSLEFFAAFGNQLVFVDGRSGGGEAVLGHGKDDRRPCKKIRAA